MKRDILQTWIVSPQISVCVDDSLCIVLATSGESPQTITNVDALKFALDSAREYVQVCEAVMRDHRDNPAVGREIMASLYPGKYITA